MVRTSASFTVQRSSNACTQCRSQKRKCDKKLPACSMCSIRSWDCVYGKAQDSVKGRRHVVSSYPISSTTTTPLNSPTTTLLALRDGYNIPRTSFPEVFFLDAAVFQKYRFPLPSPACSSAGVPLGILGQATSIDDLVTKFFDTIHPWMPIFSKRHFCALLEKYPNELPVDVTFILLCMRTLLWIPGRLTDPRTDNYRAAKLCLGDLEMAEVLSIRVLQGALLLSAYEIGHSMYPSAYLSTGALMRYGSALGLWGNSLSQVCRPFTRDELEEKRRATWVALMLDRFVTLGCPGRHTFERDPDLGASIANSGDSREMAANSAFGSEEGIEDNQSCFVLLIETTKLLGQVLTHRSNHHGEGLSTQIGAGGNPTTKTEKQLDRTLQSLITAATSEAGKYGVSVHHHICIAYSTLLTLHETSTGISHSDQASTARRMASDEIIRECQAIVTAHELDVDNLSPFWIDAIYRMAAACLQLQDAQTPPVTREEQSILTKALKIYDRRWKCAGSFLKILDATQIAACS